MEVVTASMAVVVVALMVVVEESEWQKVGSMQVVHLLDLLLRPLLCA